MAGWDWCQYPQHLQSNSPGYRQPVHRMPRQQRHQAALTRWDVLWTEVCVFVSNSVYVECVCAHTAFKCVKLVCVCVCLGMALLWPVRGYGRRLSCHLVSSCLNSGLYNLLISLERFECMKETKDVSCVCLCADAYHKPTENVDLWNIRRGRHTSAELIRKHFFESVMLMGDNDVILEWI